MYEVNLESACRVIAEGAILIYPTETCYGLGVDIRQPKAIEALFALKGRNSEKAISVLLSKLEDLETLVRQVSPYTKKIIQRFWPGPLTLVLPARHNLNPRLHGDSGWIGLRMSSDPTAQALMKKLDHPITTTSANPSGASAAYRVRDLENYFKDQELAFLSGGDLEQALASTVIKIEDEGLQLLREGAIGLSQIRSSLNT